jgi:hypothetical protein
MKASILDVSKAERDAQIETVEKNNRDFDLIEKERRLFIDGFNKVTFRRFNTELDHAQLLIITRSFHSFGCSLDLMKKAYYNQAMAVLRMMTEDYLIYWNLENNAKLLNNLLHKHTMQTNYYDLAKNIPSNMDYSAVFKIYKTQCNYTHCTKQGIATLIGRNQVKITPFYDKTMFKLCSAMLISFDSILMLSSLGNLLQGTPTKDYLDWYGQFVIINNDVKNWEDSIQVNRNAESA